jgi:hypothetical protein
MLPPSIGLATLGRNFWRGFQTIFDNCLEYILRHRVSSFFDAATKSLKADGGR